MAEPLGAERCSGSIDNGHSPGVLVGNSSTIADENTPLLCSPNQRPTEMDKTVSYGLGSVPILTATRIKRRSTVNTTDEDALRLAALGYQQQLSRKYSILSILGVGFSLTNSWFGLSAALVTGISSGGTALIVYGVVLIAGVSICVAISLSELASAMPSAGGQYYWAHELASEKWKKPASYFVGWFSWAGSIFCSASVALALAFIAVGLWQLSHPE